MIITAIILYLVCAGLLALHTAGSFVLLILFLLRRRATSVPAPLTHIPPVTVQLPVYNERYVVERLLQAVSQLDYPRDCLTIQLLDDSTDETTAIAARKVNELRNAGFHVQHIHRKDRSGYKAGALTKGMRRSKTEYYAIFDADFIPPADFLQRIMPHLEANPRVGLVQGRWGHLNIDENALTAGQALAIDSHFLIEQGTRSASGLLLSFNGTGGVWRASCIEEAGGWDAATLTEDLDLSYRAQLKGWRMITLPDVVVPGELPTQITAFKQQQARWAKGTTQCLWRTVPRLWFSRGLSLPQRIMGTLHMLQYMPYVMLVMLTLLAPPLMLSGVLGHLPLGFLVFSALVAPLNYIVSQQSLYRDWPQRLLAFPALMLFGTGVAVSNTLAMLSLLVKREMIFKRTPKAGENGGLAAYTLDSSSATTYAELALALYAAWGTWIAITHLPGAAVHLALSAMGYGMVGLWSLREQVQVHYQRRLTQAIGD